MAFWHTLLAAALLAATAAVDCIEAPTAGQSSRNGHQDHTVFASRVQGSGEPLTTPWTFDVDTSAPWPEYPRPQLQRSHWLSLNGIWEFESTGADAHPQPAKGRALASTIVVPYPPESFLSGLSVPDGGAVHMVYRRKFQVPAHWAGKHVLLHFGAVDWEALVTVNGHPMGPVHRGGYNKFHYDITDALIQGEGEQELQVDVYDPTDLGPPHIPIGKQRANPPRNPSGIFYTATSGIWQTVWLEPVSEAHITDLHVLSDVATGLVTINVSGSPQALGAPFKAVVSSEANQLALAWGQVGSPIDLAINSAKLWSPASPFLYDVDVVLLADQQVAQGTANPSVAEQDDSAHSWVSKLWPHNHKGGRTDMLQRDPSSKVDAYAGDAGPRVQLQYTPNKGADDSAEPAQLSGDDSQAVQEQFTAPDESHPVHDESQAVDFDDVTVARRHLLTQSHTSSDDSTPFWQSLCALVPRLGSALCSSRQQPRAVKQAHIEVLDSVRSYFGMRDIRLGPVGPGGHPRPLLNGEFVFQIGMLDQGFWPDGLYTPPTEEAMVSDLHLAKALGFNMLRKHIKVEPDRWYYHADRLGILVWQDMPAWFATKDVNFTKNETDQFELELTRIIQQHRPFPSIINYVVFNEGWGQYDTERVVALAMAQDKTRLFDCASGWNDAPIGSLIDMHKYVGPDSPLPTASRAAVLGEFGGLGLRIDGHRWIPSQDFSYEMQPSSLALEYRYLGLVEGLKALMLSNETALSAAVYTELSDVEAEINGFVTYDRRVVKVEPHGLPAAHRALLELSRSLNAPRPNRS